MFAKSSKYSDNHIQLKMITRQQLNKTKLRPKEVECFACFEHFKTVLLRYNKMIALPPFQSSLTRGACRLLHDIVSEFIRRNALFEQFFVPDGDFPSRQCCVHVTAFQ